MKQGFSQHTRSTQNTRYEIFYDQSVFSHPPAWRTGKSRVKRGIFSIFKPLLCTGCTSVDLQAMTPIYFTHLPVVDISPRSVRTGQVWWGRGRSQKKPTKLEKEQFRNILDCRLHQDTLLLPLNCTLSRNCSHPHAYTTSRGCLYTHTLHINVYIDTQRKIKIFLLLALTSLYPKYKNFRGIGYLGMRRGIFSFTWALYNL